MATPVHEMIMTYLLNLSIKFIKASYYCYIQIINFSRKEQWQSRCVFCYYCNALLDPISVQHPADDEEDLYGDDGKQTISRRKERHIINFTYSSHIFGHFRGLQNRTSE